MIVHFVSGRPEALYNLVVDSLLELRIILDYLHLIISCRRWWWRLSRMEPIDQLISPADTMLKVMLVCKWCYWCYFAGLPLEPALWKPSVDPWRCNYPVMWMCLAVSIYPSWYHCPHFTAWKTQSTEWQTTMFVFTHKPTEEQKIHCSPSSTACSHLASATVVTISSIFMNCIHWFLFMPLRQVL